MDSHGAAPALPVLITGTTHFLGADDPYGTIFLYGAITQLI